MITGYAFINGAGVVVNAIAGDLSPDQVTLFEHDYRVLFGAEHSVPVYEGTSVWIGGSYDSSTGVFAPPPSPIAEIIEGTSELIVEETTNDDAPIE